MSHYAALNPNEVSSSSSTAIYNEESQQLRRGPNYGLLLSTLRRDCVDPMLSGEVPEQMAMALIQFGSDEFHAAEFGGAEPRGRGHAIIITDMAGRPPQICKPGKPEPGRCHAEMRISTGYHVVICAKDAGAKQVVALYEVEGIVTKAQGGYFTDVPEDKKDENFAMAKLSLIHSGTCVSDFKTALYDERRDALLSALGAAWRKMMTVDCTAVNYGQQLAMVRTDIGAAFRESMAGNFVLEPDETLIQKMQPAAAFSGNLFDILATCHKHVLLANKQNRWKDIGLNVVVYTSVAIEETDEGDILHPYMLLSVYGRQTPNDQWTQLKTSDPISYEGLIDFLADTYGEFSRCFLPKDVFDMETVIAKFADSPYCRVLRYAGTFPVNMRRHSSTGPTVAPKIIESPAPAEAVEQVLESEVAEDSGEQASS